MPEWDSLSVVAHGHQSHICWFVVQALSGSGKGFGPTSTLGQISLDREHVPHSGDLTGVWVWFTLGLILINYSSNQHLWYNQRHDKYITSCYIFTSCVTSCSLLIQLQGAGKQPQTADGKSRLEYCILLFLTTVYSAKSPPDLWHLMVWEPWCFSQRCFTAKVLLCFLFLLSEKHLLHQSGHFHKLHGCIYLYLCFAFSLPGLTLLNTAVTSSKVEHCKEKACLILWSLPVTLKH